MGEKKKIIIFLFMLLMVSYVGYAVYLLIVDTGDSYIIKEGTLSKEDTVTGYIIRNEIVVKGDDYKNGIYTITSEGEKVAKSDAIFRYYSDSEIEATTKISEINLNIQQLLENEKNVSSADTKAIENQIESQMENVRDINKYQEILEFKSNIDGLFDKKINVIENITENNEIKKLVKEKNIYEEKMKTATRNQVAPISGVVSYKVDGLENELKPDNFNNITEEYLKEIDKKAGEIIASSKESGKVIDNFQFYIAMIMNSNEAMNAKVGDSVKLRTASKKEIQAKIVQINESSGNRVIIFQTNQMIEDLINHRKIAIDVIWWNKSGLKVPNQAIINENGLYYVIKNKAGIQSKILVKIECQTDRFSIISTYSAKDLQEIGYKEEDIKKYKKINNYDEIILQKQE